MTRKEQILQAARNYVSHVTLSSPSDVIHFGYGAKWADKNPDSKIIAEYLYKEKGYPISLNGDIPTYEEVVKHVQAYNNYKMRQKACDDIESIDAEPNLERLWHDVSEEPNNYEYILFEYISNKNELKYFTQYVTPYDCNLLKEFEKFGKCRWAYVKDLLPKGGEK